MKPVMFPEQTTTFAKNQPPYIPLPAYADQDETISCWRLTIWERVKLLFTGNIWVRQLNVSYPLQPQCLQVEHPFPPLSSSEKERAT